MYVPILRGKRFELLALRELARGLSTSGHVMPLVEPVRLNTVESDLRRAVEGWAESGGRLAVVVNPSVGEMAQVRPHSDVVNELGRHGFEAVTPVLVAPTGARNLDVAVRELQAMVGAATPFHIWVRESMPSAEFGEVLRASAAVVSRVYARDPRAARRMVRNLPGNADFVAVDDKFPGRATNAEYPSQVEQVFTEDHMFFRDEGLAGFGDFATIGHEYRDGGGAPKYVVIHWTYQITGRIGTDHPIYLQHFCSGSDYVVAPVQAKYGDAARKLVEFARDAMLVPTAGLASLLDYHARDGFPGLGMLKKISVMNHLEVVNQALSRESL